MEQYLNRLPLGLIFVSPDGAIVYATQEGRRQCLRWNRGIQSQQQNLQAGARWLLPDNISRVISDAGGTRWVSRSATDGAASWTIPHPGYADLQVRIDEYRDADASDPVGYCITFLQRSSRSAEKSDYSARALMALQELTPCERKVASLASQGLSNTQIAEVIARSVRTVEYQLNSVYKKLRVRGKTQLVLALT